MVPDVLVLPDVPDIVPLPDALRSDVPDVLPVPEELRSDVLGDVTLPDTLPPDVLGEVALPEALPPYDGVLVLPETLPPVELPVLGMVEPEVPLLTLPDTPPDVLGDVALPDALPPARMPPLASGRLPIVPPVLGDADGALPLVLASAFASRLHASKSLCCGSAASASWQNPSTIAAVNSAVIRVNLAIAWSSWKGDRLVTAISEASIEVPANDPVLAMPRTRRYPRHVLAIGRARVAKMADALDLGTLPSATPSDTRPRFPRKLHRS